MAKLFATTLVGTLPYAIGLAGSIFCAGAGFPGWLIWWLRISYALLALGALRAWWVPFLLVPEPARAARYQAMFGATHVFLPERNGIRLNTLHLALHVAVLAIVVLLAI